MAANAAELRSRLLEAASTAELPRKSSHPILTIKAPPNTARAARSKESVQSEPAPPPLIKPKVRKVKMIRSEEPRDEIGGGGDFVPNFQDLPTLKLRMGSLIRRGAHTDVVFKVGKTGLLLEAHRLILASASPVLDRLCYDNPSAEQSPDGKMILEEPDSSFVPFQVFITALYTNEVPLCLSLSMALDVFYAAKKYEVGFLQSLVLEHVSSAVTTVNVLEALALSTRMIELTPLVPACWKIIEEDTPSVLEHHLDTIESHLLGRVLARDVLNMTEIKLFQYLIRWAGVQCKRRGLKATGRRRREVMDPLLKHIRFTTMGTEVMTELVGPARILDSRETAAIMTHINGPDHQKIPVPYKTSARRIPFSRQAPDPTPSLASLDGLLEELLVDYAEEERPGPVLPCSHKKSNQLPKIRSAKKLRPKSRHSKQPLLSHR